MGSPIPCSLATSIYELTFHSLELYNIITTCQVKDNFLSFRIKSSGYWVGMKRGLKGLKMATKNASLTVDKLLGDKKTLILRH